MKTIIAFLVLATVCVAADEPRIVIDPRPESGIPAEAQAQKHDKEPAVLVLLPEGKRTTPVLRDITQGTIKSVRVRYFNPKTWKSEAAACDYVREYLAHPKLEAYGFQIWSQGVDVPEIECIVEFTDEYRRLLRDKKLNCEDGRLLIWRTESCFRDATGYWWFASAFDHYHKSHPQGDRKLAK